MELFILYLVLKADAVLTLLAVMCMFSGIGCLAMIVACVATWAEQGNPPDDQEKELLAQLKKMLKTVSTVAIVVITLTLVIPSTKSATILLGADYAIHNKDLKGVPEKAIKILNKQLDKYLKEGK